MGKETRLFKSEERRTRSEVSAFLRQLADKLDQGQVILRQGKEEIVDPYVEQGKIEIVADQWVDNWDAANALKLMEFLASHGWVVGSCCAQRSAARL